MEDPEYYHKQEKSPKTCELPHIEDILRKMEKIMLSQQRKTMKLIELWSTSQRKKKKEHETSTSGITRNLYDEFSAVNDQSHKIMGSFNPPSMIIALLCMIMERNQIVSWVAAISHIHILMKWW
jgi:hypothetical protein